MLSPCRKSGTTFLRSLFEEAFVDKIISGNIIYDLFYKLVVNMGKYLPQKGKVRQNNECRYFGGLSLLMQIFSHINHKLIR